MTVRTYQPESDSGTLGMVGFCKAEEKVLGPFQLYAPLAMEDAVRLKVVPAQTEEVGPKVGGVGPGFTVTDVLPVVVQPSTVTVTV